MPAFYDPEYNTDGTLKSFTPNNMHAPDTVKKQVVMDVTDTSYPMKPVVPFIKQPRTGSFLRFSGDVSAAAVSARQE